METILAKYGEMWLKSEKVRRKFIKKLEQNTKELLLSQGIKCNVLFLRTYILFEFEKKYIEKIQRCIANIAGIHSFFFAHKTNIDEENDFADIKRKIKEIAIKELQKEQKFAVRTKREGKHSFKSQDIEIKIGSFICSEFGNKVKLFNPDVTFFIEIKDSIAWIYTKKYKGIDGLPVGVEGNIISLIRNDKYRDDDIEATIMIIRRGGELHPIILGKEITEKDFEYIRNSLNKYDAKIAEKIDAIKCLKFQSMSFRNKLEKKVQSTKAKAICIGIRPEDMEEYYTSTKWFSQRYICIDRIPVFLPLIGMDKIQFK